jgi:hypothetical protein
VRLTIRSSRSRFAARLNSGVMPQDLSDIVDLLSKKRKYASFFEWLDKEGKELGVAEELVRALNSAEALDPNSLAPCYPDPPDLTCRTDQGELIAIEVSEIVCVEAVRANQKGHDVFRVWGKGELQSAIAESLSRKDKVNPQGGPYHRFYVCLFTDEMMLTHQGASDELSNVVFGPFNQITDAFLLFSYQPATKSYPVLRLRIGA